LLKELNHTKLLEIISDTKRDSRGKTADFLQNLYDEISS
jgi:hypothetical protein